MPWHRPKPPRHGVTAKLLKLTFKRDHGLQGINAIAAMLGTNPKLWPNNLRNIRPNRRETQRFHPIQNGPGFDQASIPLQPGSGPTLATAAERCLTVVPELSCKRHALKVSQARRTQYSALQSNRALVAADGDKLMAAASLNGAPTGETGLESFDAPTAVAPGTLMTGAHSPWPLFCNDLAQAQQWVSLQLAHTPADRGQLGHQALSLGLTTRCNNSLIRQSRSLEETTQRQWKFRLARLNGCENPYAELIPPDVQAFTDLQMDHARRMGIPVVVSLLGGIGDHLEVISMLLEWSRIEQILIMQVTPQRQLALTPLISQSLNLAMQSSVNPEQSEHGNAGMDLQTLWLHKISHMDHKQV